MIDEAVDEYLLADDDDGGVRSLGEIIAEFGALLTRPQERHPVLRTGERQPICPLLRYLVWHRDGGVCKQCGTHHDQSVMELDHVIPWSALGPDCGTNLRVLCQPCNQERSNWRLRFILRLLPVTAACDDCVREPVRRLRLVAEHRCLGCFGTRLDAATDLDVDDVRLAFCGQCMQISNVTNRSRLL